MADAADDHHHGEMDIHEQVHTYRAFLDITKWFCLVLAVTLVFFIMLFSTGVGFLGSAASAFILLVIGVVALSSKPKPH